MHSSIPASTSSHGQRFPYTLQEICVLLLYPVTTILTHLIHYALSSSEPEPIAPSILVPSTPTQVATPATGLLAFFTSKNNFLNTVIVKQSWAWVTVLCLWHLWTLYKNKQPSAPVNYDSSSSSTALESSHNQFLSTPARRFLFRYLTASLWFILFTQWCFGLPLMDRVFVLTGGGCQDTSGVLANSDTTTTEISIGTGAFPGVSSRQCRKLGGTWAEGYDPSGHLFVVSQSSLLLWYEVIGPISRHKQRFSALAISTALFMSVLWWMLVMTNLYFHSFAESIAGLAAGYVEIILVYHVFRNHIFL